MRVLLSLTWLVTLIVAHIYLRLAHPNLGPEPSDAMPYLFFGLNLPTMLVGLGMPLLKSSQMFASPMFIGGMALIMMNFMFSGFEIGSSLAGTLIVLTAQSLWLAFPVYWMASHPTPGE